MFFISFTPGAPLHTHTRTHADRKPCMCQPIHQPSVPPYNLPHLLGSTLVNYLIWYLDLRERERERERERDGLYAAWMWQYEQQRRQKEDWPFSNQLCVCVCVCVHLIWVDAPLHNSDESMQLASNHEHISWYLSSFTDEDCRAGIAD